MLVSTNVTLLSSSVLIYMHDLGGRKNLILEMSLLTFGTLIPVPHFAVSESTHRPDACFSQ